MNDCIVRVDDVNLSRYHCFIGFEGGWYIQDGDGRKSSTNGTWLFGGDFLEINNGMVFKAAETLFKVLNI